MCDIDKYTDQCSINAFLSSFQCDSHPSTQIRTNDYEIFGQYSRCLPFKYDDKNHTGCFETKCDSSMKKISITYKVGELNLNAECTRRDEEVTLGQTSGITIVCPDPSFFCPKSGVLNCKNDCSGVGMCKKNKQCFCDILYEGDDCSMTTACTDSLCEELLLAQNFALRFYMGILFAFLFVFLD